MSTGTVIKSTGSHYEVRTEGGDVFVCRIKGKLRLSDIKSTNPLAVGDFVEFNIEDSQLREGIVSRLLPRKNYVVRRSTNLSKQTHILAANVDQALLVATINYPITTSVFIDRFLASAEAYNVPVVIVFNKTDRYNDEQMQELNLLRTIYTDMGYEVCLVSAAQKQGIDEVRRHLTGKVSVIAGHSGVGKSTLINSVEPGLDLRTSEISEANNSGRHTTTNAEMHPFSFGGYVIDTPGIRGFGLTDMDRDEVAHYFRDIFQVSSDCQFANCTHTHEPGCAVKLAVEEGRIAYSRYKSYLNIVENEEGKYR